MTLTIKRLNCIITLVNRKNNYLKRISTHIGNWNTYEHNKNAILILKTKIEDCNSRIDFLSRVDTSSSYVKENEINDFYEEFIKE